MGEGRKGGRKEEKKGRRKEWKRKVGRKKEGSS